MSHQLVTRELIHVTSSASTFLVPPPPPLRSRLSTNARGGGEMLGHYLRPRELGINAEEHSKVF